jgi:hypothetical protein
MEDRTLVKYLHQSYPFYVDTTRKQFSFYFDAICSDPSTSGEADLYIHYSGLSGYHVPYLTFSTNEGIFDNISVREVLREAGIPSLVKFTTKNVIVRCMGETI